MLFFRASAVGWPMSRLCLRRIYRMMASSKLSPAVLMESDSTTPPAEITAASVVPLPMSRIIWPLGRFTSSPAPTAEATLLSTR